MLFLFWLLIFVSKVVKPRPDCMVRPGNLWTVQFHDPFKVENPSMWKKHGNVQTAVRQSGLVNRVCKVEFNQPFCWLYSVPILLVIQHLETLYLGGNHVRVVCERVWREAQEYALSKTSWLGLTTSSQLASCQRRHTCEACKGAEESRQLEHYMTKLPIWPGS